MFHRPCGKPSPEVLPPTAGLADQVVAANIARGLGITADTPIPDWDGHHPDYPLAVAVLYSLDQST
jgi:hypothetical protein